MTILLDAGPSLNFLAVRQENVLIQVAASQSLTLSAPYRVDVEVEGMTRDPRFRNTAVSRTWRTLKSTGRVQILDDTLNSREFTEAVGRVSGKPHEDRMKERMSLGEIVVIAHASVFAQDGEQVFILIDEADGRRRARLEQAWLDRHNAPGSITLWSTPQLLKEAARHEGWLRDAKTWEQVYDQMTKFDHGSRRLAALAEPARTVRALIVAGRTASKRSAYDTAEKDLDTAARVARSAGLAELGR